MSRPTYTVSDGARSITCHLCGRTSYHPADVHNHFCSRCKVFHDDLPKDTRRNKFKCWLDKPIIWLDQAERPHLSIPALLKWADIPDTPQNRQVAIELGLAVMESAGVDMGRVIVRQSEDE
jgi:ribosomal protein L37E